MFTKRLVSGIILVILAIIIVGKGGALLYGVTALISLIGLFELYRVLKIEKNAMGVVGYITALSYYGLVWFDGHHYVTLMAIAALMVMMAIYVFTFPKYRTEEVAESFFGVFYVAVMLSYLYQVRAMGDGRYLVWLIFLSSWGCDTSAYCVGMLLGKHKLAPVLRRCCGRRSRRGASGLFICNGIWRKDDGAYVSASGLHAGLCHCGCHLPDRRPGGIRDQAQPRHQGLRQPDPGTRRNPGPFRQHAVYGSGNLFCPAVSAVV